MQPTHLKIRLYGDPILTKKAVPVKDIGPGERLLIESMLHTMYMNKGIGLAAPQVGIDQRIFVADIGDGPIAIINPRILKKSGSKSMDEGCLSIPGINVTIKRPQKITVTFTDINNNKHTVDLENLLACWREFLCMRAIIWMGN
jgi:peptide deformylase